MHIRPTLSQLAAALEVSWDKETAQVPDVWSASNPAAGQCWQSAYVVRHFLGGDILVAEVVPQANPVQRHAWNRLLSGEEVDLTRSQFPQEQQFALCTVPESLIRSVVGTKAELLLARVERALAEAERAA